MKRLLSVVLALLLVLGSASPALAAKAEAVTMRVELVEGNVTIKTAGGVPLDYSDGTRLYSGYSVETGDDSCAYISLDDEKAIKLAMNTAVTIRKSGHKLQVMLKAGSLVFNVTKPLAANEDLEIRTGAMVTSVRGSSGGVNAETGEIFYGTGHGIVWFRETDQTGSLYGLPQRTELWGGRIVSVNWPVKDMELSDFSALFLGEVAENPDLQDSLKMEGRFDPQDMIALLPSVLEEEAAAREEAKETAVPLPESAKDSPVDGDNVNPAFNKNWDLPTIVTPPPIIPDVPLNPDEPEPAAEPELRISLTEGVQITVLTDTQEDGDFSGEGVTFTSESEELTMNVAPGTWVVVHCETDEDHTFLGDDVLLIDGVPRDNGEAFQVTKDVEISAKAYYRITNVKSLTDGLEMDSVLDSNLTIDSAVTISLNRNVTIMPGVTLNINNEAAGFTIGEGVTLTIDGTLTNKGTIINNGTIVNNGAINNNGQLLNCGTLVSDASGSVIENTGVFLPKASNDAASDFTYVGEFENAVTGDGTIVEYGGLCNDDGSDVTWYLTDAETAGKYVLHITGAGAIQDYEYTGTGGSGGTADYIVESPWWDMKDNITELDLGNQITGIGAFAFAHSKITGLTVPAGVKYLGSYSFYKSPALSSLTIGSGVTEIRDHAFSDCDSLTTLVVPDNVTSIGASAFYSSMLQTVEIGSGVANIGYYAFAYCTGMYDLTLSEGLVSISDHAFFNCWSLTSVSIPPSVQNIDDEAFCDCNQLNKASFAGDPPTLGTDVFKNTPESFCIYYPDDNANWVITDGKWNGYPAASYQIAE